MTLTVGLEDRKKFAAEYLKLCLMEDAPKDTGNLAFNSIRIDNNNPYVVLLGGEVAPYAEFTNEPWKKGTNPNEHWIQRSVERALPGIRNFFMGSYSYEDAQKQVDTEYNNVANTFDDLIKEKGLDHLDKKAYTYFGR